MELKELLDRIEELNAEWDSLYDEAQIQVVGLGFYRNLDKFLGGTGWLNTSVHRQDITPDGVEVLVFFNDGYTTSHCCTVIVPIDLVGHETWKPIEIKAHGRYVLEAGQ